MLIYIIRHAKSDKSMKDTLSHEEFEKKRPILNEEESIQLGQKLKEKHPQATFQLVHSGKLRSKQTLIAIAKGLGINTPKLIEDTRITYQVKEEYLKKAKESKTTAQFYLQNPPEDGSMSAEELIEGMNEAIKDIPKETDVAIVVSHEPVISLWTSNFMKKEPEEACKELEYGILNTTTNQLTYKGKTY